MPTITIDNRDSHQSLEQFYQDTLEYLRQKYHTWPDVMPRIPMNARTQSDLAAFERLAEQSFQNAQRDERTSNGVPRRTNVRWGG